MALTSTMHRLVAQLSDVDRGVYESLDVRLARHPSETARHLVLRALAYCLSTREGLTLGPGLSDGEEPALSVRSLDGRMLAWIDVGAPSAERLHKASKACPEVVVFTAQAPAAFLRELGDRPIHRREALRVLSVEVALLDALAARLDRTLTWDVLHTDGTLYVTVAGETLSGAVTPVPLE